MNRQPPRGGGRSGCFILLALASFLCACTLETVREPVELVTPEVQLGEDALLDVSIALFTPRSDPAVPDQDANLRNLRKAESIHAAWRLAQALQASGSWGAVRISPGQTGGADLTVSGEILQSDGQTLRIHARARDARGREWLDRIYKLVVEAGHYENLFSGAAPFQDLYDQMANDILEQRMRVDVGEARLIRQVARLKFAAEFAPEAYEPYLAGNAGGLTGVSRLPAANDEIFAHVGAIRLRNESFLDSVQANYGLFIEKIREPYYEFLRRSHNLTVRINSSLQGLVDVNAQTTPVISLYNMMLFDPGAIHARSGTRLPPTVARSDRLNRGRNSQIYARFLIGSGQVFEEDLRPIALQFEENTLSLTGSVEEQFTQWREILDEMYRLETEARD